MLAGVSVDYYTRLERGNLKGVSDAVLEAVATALQLDEAERMHLVDLARAAGTSAVARRSRSEPAAVRPSIQAMLDAMTGAPAVVRNDRLDILAGNTLSRALYAPLYADPRRPANHARFAFLDPAAKDYWLDWSRAADDTVGTLRGLAGRNPYDKGLTVLVYTAEPGSPTADALTLLASWAATAPEGLPVSAPGGGPFDPSRRADGGATLAE